MTTTTNVEQVKLNIMTTNQYDNSSKSDTELYVLTDATAMPMDDELSLSSENPVKNSVITARSNAIQVELDDKLNKSIVWNKLNRAYGWTYRHLNGEGNAYLLYYTTANGWAYSDAYSVQNVLSCNAYYSDTNNSNYICLDNQLYYVTSTNTNNVLTFTLTPMGNNNCSCFISSASIIDNNLYTFSNSSLTLKDSGGWTKISAFTNSSDYYTFGIKNDNLYYLSSYISSITLKDSGIWSDVVGFTSSTNVCGFGIRDSKLYSLNTSGITKISDETGWTMISGYDENASNTYSCGFGIRNGKLYRIKGNGVTLLDETETWVKVTGCCGTSSSYNYGAGLTQSGKIYHLSYSTITQVGTDTTWTYISGDFHNTGGYLQLTAIKNGDVYVFSSNNYTPTKITNMGNITKVYEGCFCNNGSRCGIFWTGSVTEDIHSVYTIASPSVGFNTYSNTNLQILSTVSATSSSPYTITDQFYTYTRDASIDGVFTGISEDSSKQLMSMKDFLSCFTE